MNSYVKKVSWKAMSISN